MSKSVTGLLPNSTIAETVVTDLRTAGFNQNEVSLLFAENDKNKVFMEQHSKAPEGAATGAGTGGVVGGVLGWLIGIGSLAIPGVGPFIAAGPIMAALSGAAIGAATGGVIGSLVGLGIPEIEAKKYENKIKEGYVLIAVHTDNPEQQKKAKEILQRQGAEEISEIEEAA